MNNITGFENNIEIKEDSFEKVDSLNKLSGTLRLSSRMVLKLQSECPPCSPCQLLCLLERLPASTALLTNVHVKCFVLYDVGM